MFMKKNIVLSLTGWFIFNRTSIAVDLLPRVVDAQYTDQVVEGMLGLAACYQTLGEADSAKQIYEKILAAAPDNAIANQLIKE